MSDENVKVIRNFLLKLGNGADPVVYQTVAAMEVKSQEADGDVVRIVAEGRFNGPAAWERIRVNALSGALDDYRLSFEDGSLMTGRFVLKSMSRVAFIYICTIELESRGEVVSS